MFRNHRGLLAILALAGVFCAPAALCAPVLLGTDGTGESGGGNVTVNFTAPIGTNRMVVLTASSRENSSGSGDARIFPSSVTCSIGGGAAVNMNLGERRRGDESSNTSVGTAQYYLAIADSTATQSGSIAVSYSSNAQTRIMHVRCIGNIDQTAPRGAANYGNTNKGNSTAMSTTNLLNGPVPQDYIVIGSAAHRNHDNTWTAAAGQTKIWDGNLTRDNLRCGASYRVTPAAENVDMQITTSGSNYWAMVGVAYKSKYRIVASAGANGSISPSGSQNYNFGDDPVYTFTPATNYVVDTVTVDGSSVGAPASYTFTDVNANHTIAVTFKLNTAPTDITPNSMPVNDDDPNGTQIGTLTVVDAGITTPFTWAEVSGSTGAFALGTPSGFTVPVLVQNTNIINRGAAPSMTYRVRVTDAGGLQYEESITFSVIDTTKPVISSCAAAQNGTADASCQATVPSFTAGVTATDNVGVTSRTQVPTAGSLVGPGANPVVVTVSDAAGNTASCTTSFNVTDTTTPVITQCAPDQAASAGSTCTALVPDFTAGVIAVENCDELTITQSPLAGTEVGLGVTDVTITVTDEHAHSVQCTAHFTVTDDADPVITQCPDNEVFTGAPGDCSVALPDLTTEIIATDNCTAAGDLVIAQTPPAGTLVGAGDTVVTITVKDAAENTAQCEATITLNIDENVPPTITACAPNQSVDADAGGCTALVPDFTAGVTATDNCATSFIVTQEPEVGETASVGDTTIVITVDDGAGNTASCEATLTVEDAEEPSITCPAPATVPTASGQCRGALPDLTTLATASDLCGTVMVTQVPVAGTMADAGVTAVTLTAEDEAGNTAECSVDVTVQDQEAPVLTAAGGAAVNVALNSVFTDPGATAVDNCAVSATPVGTVVAGDATFDTSAGGNTWTIEYAVSDDAGNPAAPVQTVFTVVEDLTAPVISGADAPLVVACGTTLTAGVALAGVSAVDDQEGSVLVLVEMAGLPLYLSPDGGPYAIEYSAADSVNNIATVVRTIAVQDDCSLSVEASGKTNVVAEEEEPISLAVIIEGAIGATSIQWFFEEDAKTFELIPSANDPAYSFTLTEDTDGRYYAEVTDAVTTVQSDVFSVSIGTGVPVGGPVGLAFAAAAVAALGAAANLRRGRTRQS